MFHSVLITLDCDFEESHLCGYSNQWNANVNWYVGGRTQLHYDNIPNDHTFNNKTGKIFCCCCLNFLLQNYFFPSFRMSRCGFYGWVDGWMQDGCMIM